MSEVKRYDFYIAYLETGEEIQGHLNREGSYVEYEDYESERLAHEETKRNHASVVERLFYSEREQLKLDNELEATKKRLEELEDAIRRTTDFRLGEHKPVFNTDYELINQAIQNSRERQEENRLRTKVAKFIDRNGGEAMG